MRFKFIIIVELENCGLTFKKIKSITNFKLLWSNIECKDAESKNDLKIIKTAFRQKIHIGILSKHVNEKLN